MVNILFMTCQLLPWSACDCGFTVSLSFLFPFFSGLTFDQQQQDPVDDASKALYYR
jgi:hypothetical protein